MPIDIKTFELAKNPSVPILEFLKKEPDKAFMLSEIYEGVKILQELEISQARVSRVLDDLVREGQIEVAWIKGFSYYKIKERETLFS